MDTEQKLDSIKLADGDIEIGIDEEGSEGFWVKAADGTATHIKGDIDMSDEVVDALIEAMMAARSEYCFHERTKEAGDNLIQRSRFRSYRFECWRCPDCKTAFVEVLDTESDYVFCTLTPRVEKIRSLDPDAGYAYHWWFMGENHRSIAIRGLSPKETATDGAAGDTC